MGMLGCSSDPSIEEISYLEKIQGEWKSELLNIYSDTNRLTFTFQDSTCSYLFPYGEFSKYSINGDTLNITERREVLYEKVYGGKLNYQFLIASLTDSLLYLIPVSKYSRGLFKIVKDRELDTIKLSRLNKINEWKIERIGFNSTACFGTCPSMYLEIDSTGLILFNGKSFTQNVGLFSGRVSPSQFKQLISRINNIQLDSLKLIYAANRTCSQTCSVKIKTSTNEYESSAYGSDKEPIELRLLFHKLMELHKEVEMVQDSTILDKFEFQEFSHRGDPPSIPSE